MTDTMFVETEANEAQFETEGKGAPYGESQVETPATPKRRGRGPAKVDPEKPTLSIVKDVTAGNVNVRDAKDGQVKIYIDHGDKATEFQVTTLLGKQLRACLNVYFGGRGSGKPRGKRT